MGNWKTQIGRVKRKIYQEKSITLTLPSTFAFRDHNTYDFNNCLGFFDWNLSRRPVSINFKKCTSANYQSMSLLVLYCWRLREQGCRITFVLDDKTQTGSSKMWKLMGAVGLFHVSTNDKVQFKGHEYKPLIGIRNNDDFKLAISKSEIYTKDFNVEYMNTLRYVLSEILYNTLEHGVSYFRYKGVQKRMPSIIQFTWYQSNNEIHFLVSDIGVGIKEHLSQTYTGLESDEAALRLAIQPNVSGTFGITDPYKSKDNAGVGLFLSSNIVRKLNAEMHIVSGNGVIHISPRDITSKTISRKWPGTIVLVSVKIEVDASFALHSMMQEFRESASRELAKGTEKEDLKKFYVSIYNYFGPYAEDKTSAISFRDNHIIPALSTDKIILVDFDNVNSAPHSFLSALLATPIKQLGLSAYKKIKIINSSPEIRETIDFILDENTE